MVSRKICLGMLLLAGQVILVAGFASQRFRHERAHAPTTALAVKRSSGDMEFSTSRRGAIASLSLLGAVIAGPQPSFSKSYSQNARNMERLNSGDASGGSVYDNNPSSESARKRRAMTGCKFDSARKEAAGGSNLSEKDCNQRVMGGETEFMLSALRKLDCPTCPYGIASK